MEPSSRIKSFQELVDKVDQLKKQEKMDLSSDQDLSIAIMNLISIEEHFFFSGAKTGKNEYYDWINDVREIRKELLKKIIIEYDGEIWCISKHLLAASMRLMEVGTKQLSMNNNDVAYDLFGKAFDLYSLFWALNMKLTKTSSAKTGESAASEGKVSTVNIGNTTVSESKSSDFKNMGTASQQATTGRDVAKKSFLSSLSDLVKRAIDCCLE